MATPFKLRNGMLLLSTEAPGGIYNAAQLRKIAELTDGDAAIVKATEDQRLALFVPEAKAKAVVAALKATGLGVRNYQDGMHQPVNCIGELCGDHAQDAMGLSMDLTQELARIALKSPLKIGINGCARCCVATHTLDVSVIGEPTGYRVSLGGKNSAIPELASFMAEGVPADKLPKMLGQVVALFKELAQAGESLQDVMERCGTGRFVEALAPYSQDAAADAVADPFGGPEAVAVADADAFGGLEALPAEIDDMPKTDEPLMDDMPDLDVTDDTDDIPLGHGLTDDAGMDDIAILRDGEGGSLEGDLSPFPDDDDGLLEGTADDAVAVARMATPQTGVPDLGDDLESMEALDETSELEMMDDLDPTDELAAPPLEELDVEPEEIEDLSDMAVAPDLEELAFDDEPAPKAVPDSVVAALAPSKLIGSDDDEDLAAAVEVDGDEADAFEAKLEESIAEEERSPVAEDENANARLAAIDLVESNADLPSVEAVAANLGVDDSFDNLEIESTVDAEAELLEDVAAGFDDPSPANVSPMIAAPRPAPQPLRPATSAGGFEFRGIDLGEGGRLTLSFSSGATVVLDPRTMAPGVTREFTVGGKRIVISQAAAGFTVDVDGVGIFLPVAAA